jgi:hypothetical protein
MSLVPLDHSRDTIASDPTAPTEEHDPDILLIIGDARRQKGVGVGVGVELGGGVQQEQLLVSPSKVHIGGTSH